MIGRNCHECALYRAKQTYCSSRKQIVPEDTPACSRFLPIVDPQTDPVETRTWITVDITPEEDSEEVRESKRKRHEKAVELYSQGERPTQIASRLGVSTPTVRSYLAHAAAKGEIELRPEDVKGKSPKGQDVVPEDDSRPVEETREVQAADSTVEELSNSEQASDLSPILDRITELEIKLEAIQSLPTAVQELYDRTTKAKVQIDNVTGLHKSIVSRIDDLDRKMMNMAVRLVEVSGKLEETSELDPETLSIISDLQRGIRRLEDDRRSLATALLELLNDLRYHHHGEAGTAVLPSTIPTPRYAGRIAELRDKSEVLNLGETRPRNGSTNGSYSTYA